MEDYSTLIIAAGVFLAAHIGMSTHPTRDRLIGAIGKGRYLIAYTVLAFITFGWLLYAFGQAPKDYLWLAPTWVRHLPMGLMLVVCVLIVAGYMRPNPTAVGTDRLSNITDGPKGIFRITRHPILCAIALWALVHMPASGQASALILQGAIGLLAIIGMHQIDRRKSREYGEEWTGFADKTSVIPFAAILGGRQRFVFAEIGWLPILGGVGLYVLLISAHPHIIGVSPLPMP